MNEKDELEIQKLKYELRELKKPALKKIATYQIVLPFLIGFISVIVLYKNGLFDFKTKQLELRRDNLEYDIRRFDDLKDSITHEKKLLADEIESLRDSTMRLRTVKNDLDSIIQFSRDSLIKANNYLIKISDENRRLSEINEKLIRQEKIDLGTYSKEEYYYFDGSGKSFIGFGKAYLEQNIWMALSSYRSKSEMRSNSLRILNDFVSTYKVASHPANAEKFKSIVSRVISEKFPSMPE